MSEGLTSSRNFESTHSGFRLLRHKYVWLALTPFVLSLLFFGYQSFREWQADQAIKQQIAQWDQAGVPFDNDSMQMYYLQKTFPEGHADWARVIQLTNWGMHTKSYAQLPYLGHEGEPPEVLVPDDNNDQWADDALVAGYLDEIQPVIDLIEKASEHPNPVRFPMHFQGFGTLLPHTQMSRSIARILSLDCDYAYSHHDTPRTMRDLLLMQSNIDAFDSRDFLVSLLVTNAARGMRFRSVRRTLTHCVWDESQLAALRESMSAEKDIAAPFREGILAERALALASLDGSIPLDELLGLIGQSNRFANPSILPSDIQLLIEYYNEILEAADGPIEKWTKRAKALERRLNTENQNSIAALVLPATTQCIGNAINVEETRRWTLTAIALRQYYQQHDSWPPQLSDMETLGLKFADYSNMRGEMFGYEVDGETAYLWKDEFYEKGEPISSTRPTPPSVSEDQREREEERLKDFLLELR